MPISTYHASIPVLTQFLTSLKAFLEKAEAYVTVKNIPPDALLKARLFPDMFDLTQQVQLASDFAKSTAGRLTGVDMPSYPDTERTFSELQARLDNTLKFIGSITPAQFENAETREIILRAGTANEKRFTGAQYLLHYSMPQFIFHVTTAYDILRHNGIEIGKKDFLGNS